MDESCLLDVRSVVYQFVLIRVPKEFGDINKTLSKRWISV